MQATELRTAEEITEREATTIEPGRQIFRQDRDYDAARSPSGSSVLTALPLVAADVLAVLASLAIACKLATTLWPASVLDWRAQAAGFSIGILLASLAVGLYPGIGLSSISEIRRSSTAVLLLGLVFLIVSLIERRSTLPIQFVILATCSLLLVTLPLTRILAREVFSRFGWWGEPAFIVGSAPAATLYSFLLDHPRLGLRPIGIIGDWEAQGGIAAPPYLLGPLSHAAALLGEFGTPWLVVAMPDRPHDEVQTIVQEMGRHAAHRTVISDLDGSPGLWTRASDCLDWPGSREGSVQTALGLLIKRGLDLALTIGGGLLILPLLVLLAALVRFYSPGPVFYGQERIGHNGRRFKAWKFRSMICDADRVLQAHLAANPAQREEWDRTHKLQRDPRITPIGRLLRKSSLDELPQLWNVLRGEMSLVGPRPIVSAEVAKYGNRFQDYCSVMPGITGLWQVSGRNDTTYDERVELDSYYARHWSVWLDLQILLSTIKVVLFRHGAY